MPDKRSNGLPGWARFLSLWLPLAISLAVVGGVVLEVTAGPYQWFQAANESHDTTSEHQELLPKLVEAIDRIGDKLCKQEVRGCMEDARARGEDPIPCLDTVQCAEESDD